MKSFREQFIECRKNSTCEVKNLEKPETIYPLFHEPIQIETQLWCKRFNHQCRSDVCKLYRDSISFN